MSNRVKIIGIDPSLRNTGIATGWLDIDTLEWGIDSLHLAKTEKGKEKTVRKSSEDYDRSRIIYEALKVAEHDAAIAFVEMPIGSQSAAAMKSYGMCIGLIASLDCPVIQVAPGQVKDRAVGSKTATKEEMIEWAHNLFPNINWLRHGGRLMAANEHLADAVAAINAGVKSDDFIGLVKMMKKFSMTRA